MAHRALKSGYSNLADRLNRVAQGAPPTGLLFQILGVLFQERGTALVAQLPIRPFTASKAAKVWKLGETEARKVLEDLAGRALLVDWEKQVLATRQVKSRYLERLNRGNEQVADGSARPSTVTWSAGASPAP